MVSFAVQLTPPPKGSRSLALSPRSFLKCDDAIQNIENKLDPHIKSIDSEMVTLQPRRTPGNRSIESYLDRTGAEKLVVLLPADAKLQQASDKFRGMKNENKTLGGENSFFKGEFAALKTLVQSTKEAARSAEEKAQSAEEKAQSAEEKARSAKEDAESATAKAESSDKKCKELDSELEEARMRRLHAMAGNLMIEFVEKLLLDLKLKAASKGNDPDASKTHLVDGADQIYEKFGKPHPGEKEPYPQADAKWEKGTKMSKIYRRALKDFEKLLKARNEQAHETSNEFARLLLSKRFKDQHEHLYWGPLLEYVKDRTVEDLAKEGKSVGDLMNDLARSTTDQL